MISIDTSLAGARNFLRNLVGIIIPATQDELGKTVSAVKKKMSVEGKPSTSPVQWDSEKQRKAYFATKGFGKGIPYKRTGEYKRGWKVERINNGYTLSNKHPAAAVGGFLDGWQSRIHRGRWQNLTAAFYTELAKLPRNILTRLTTSVKGSAKP